MSIQIETKSQEQLKEKLCKTDVVTEKLFESKPKLKKAALERYSEFLKREQLARRTGSRRNNANREIPVVFHIIHQCGEELIGEQQIQEAINDVNDDFNKRNHDALKYESLITNTLGFEIADVGISFKLASVDPYGNATTGITHTEHYYTNQGSNFELQIKDLIQWPRNKYLNVWVVSTTGGSGFAHFPTTVHDYPQLDGIVISHNYLGRSGTSEYQRHGRGHILTHEIGHWLGLYHAWGKTNSPKALENCGISSNSEFYDDDVCDTPNTIGDTKIVYPTDSVLVDGTVIYQGVDSYYGDNDGLLERTDLPNTCSSSTCPVTLGYDNVFNFMDYGCEIIFSEGQKSRMLMVLNDNIAQRSEIGLPQNKDEVFIPHNSNSVTMTFDTYFFQEHSLNDGSIKEKGIEIKLSAGAFNFNTLFSTDANSNNYFEVNNLPAGLILQISRDNFNGGLAHMKLLGNAFNNNKIDSINDLEIIFKQAAFDFDLQLLYNSTISNLEIDYLEEFDDVYYRYLNPEQPEQQFCVNSLIPNDYEPFFLDHIGYMALHNFKNKSTATTIRPEGVYLANESGILVEVLCNNNTNPSGVSNVAIFEKNYTVNSVPPPGFSYKAVTRGPYSSNALMIYGDIYTANAGKSGLIGIKITYGCENLELLGWLRVSVSDDGQDLCIQDAFYSTNPNEDSIKLEDLNCTASGGTGDYNYISEVKISNDTDVVFLSESPNYVSGYTDYTDITVFPDRTCEFVTGESYNIEMYQGNNGSQENNVYWYIWIDYNDDNIFDITEKVFTANGVPEVKSNFGGMPQLYIPLNAPVGEHKMRILQTYYSRASNRYLVSPCNDFLYGEVEDYNIAIVSNLPEMPSGEQCFSIVKYNGLLPVGIISAYDYIECSENARVADGQRTVLKASNYIDLLLSTTIENGSYFEVLIEDCEPD